MKECEKYAALLDAFAEGDLFTEDLIQVQRHLMDCPDCQAYLEDLMAMQAAFPTVEETEVPEGFSARVMAAVAQTPQSAVPAAAEQKTKARKAPWGRVLASLAACCAIVILMKAPILGGGSSAPAAKFSAQAETTAEAPAEAKMMAEPQAPAAEEAMEYNAEDAIGAASGSPSAAYDGALADTATEPEMGVTESYHYTADLKSKTTEIAGEECVEVTMSTTTTETAAEEAVPEEAAPELILTAAEAGSLLARFTPAEELETELRYELSAQEYISLLTVLPREIRQSAPANAGETMTVIVLK